MRTHSAYYEDREDSSRIELYREVGGQLEGKTVLDAGCGFGKDIPIFLQRGAIVHGIDVSQRMIELARQNFPDQDQNLSVQDFSNTDFDNEAFDLIFSRYSLHYSPDLTKTFQEFHRVLKQNGGIVAVSAHPLLGFITKPRRIYWEKENTSIRLFDGTCIVEEPTHTFDEWISPYVLEHFHLERFYEHPNNDNHVRETDYVEQVPDFFLMKLRKK